MNRRSFWGLAAIVLAAVAVVSIAAAVLGSSGQAQPVTGRSTMDQRLDQLIRVLNDGQAGTQAHMAAIDEGMEILYGGLRPLPSKGEALAQTTAADQAISVQEMHFAQALDNFANAGGSESERGRALDLKLFIEQMNEVAAAVGAVTKECGEGDRTNQPPCDNLQPLLDEETGEELTPGGAGVVIRPSYSVKLRSPFVAPWIRGWQHDVRVPAVIDKGQCAVVFKETRGLMVRLHFQRIIVVTDAWVTTFGVPRGTRVPIWYLSWVPSQYAKTWNICNVDGKTVRTLVSQRVKQDHALNFFWRYYPGIQGGTAAP